MCGVRFYAVYWVASPHVRNRTSGNTTALALVWRNLSQSFQVGRCARGPTDVAADSVKRSIGPYVLAPISKPTEAIAVAARDVHGCLCLYFEHLQMRTCFEVVRPFELPVPRKPSSSAMGGWPPDCRVLTGTILLSRKRPKMILYYGYRVLGNAFQSEMLTSRDIPEHSRISEHSRTSELIYLLPDACLLPGIPKYARLTATDVIWNAVQRSAPCIDPCLNSPACFDRHQDQGHFHCLRVDPSSISMTAFNWPDARRGVLLQPRPLLGRGTANVRLHADSRTMMSVFMCQGVGVDCQSDRYTFFLGRRASHRVVVP